jgi:hypothetical protein
VPGYNWRFGSFALPNSLNATNTASVERPIQVGHLSKNDVAQGTGEHEQLTQYEGG